MTTYHPMSWTKPKKVNAKFNWGAGVPFEVPPEDVLEARPEPLSEEWLLAHEVEPSPWTLRALSKIGGHRHPKREVIHTKWPSRDREDARSDSWGDDRDDSPIFSPHRPVFHGQPMGPHGPSVLEPNEAETAIYNKSMARRERRKGKKGRANTPSPLEGVQQGNLREDDYRYWKGFTLPNDKGAQCRWCGCIVESQQQMEEHHSKKKCKEHLLALYRFAKLSKKQRFCFTCAGHVNGKGRWGIPLCRTAACISRWKFSFVELLQGYRRYRDLSEEEQTRNPTEGPFSHLRAPAGEFTSNL